MNSFNPGDQEEKVDQAVAGRLAKLRTMPVDTSRLEKALRQQIPQSLPERSRRMFQIRPIRFAAASIAILSIIAAVFLTSASGPALASAAQMAQMHQDIVSGKSPVMQVDSIAAANWALSAQSPQSPQVPSVPADHVMACCMKNVKDKKVACVLLKDEGIPITLTVANAADMRSPATPATIHEGVTYHAQSFVTSTGTLNMVMTERNGRWVCLIGQISADRLMDLAAKLSF